MRTKLLQDCIACLHLRRFTDPGTAEFRGYVTGFNSKLDRVVIERDFMEKLALTPHEVTSVKVHGRSGSPYAWVDFQTAAGLEYAVHLKECNAACRQGQFLTIEDDSVYRNSR